MDVENKALDQNISRLCRELEREFIIIPDTRKQCLQRLSAYLREVSAEGRTSRVIFICTHNSRRSHLAQLWLSIAADRYGLARLRTFSGGTEATAFNSRMVEALRRAGVTLEADAYPNNPVYRVSWRKDMKPYAAFSKVYTAAPNPSEGFAAVMVCTEADAGCPVVTGCDFRLSLPYDDPKAYDDTPREAAAYAAKVREIGREMLYVISQV